MHVKKIAGVEAVRGGEMQKGDMHLTDHHIVMVIPPAEPTGRPRELYIAYPILAHCNFRPSHPASGRPSTIRLRCRDFMFISFHFTEEAAAREAFEHIRNHTCRLGSIEKLYAFSYQPLKQEKHLNGWEIYDPKTEFRRQGISIKSVDRGWRISTINQDYAFSPTYPGLLVVPSNISDNVIKHAGPYRSRQRIPVLTYLHSLNNCSITRSSQPRTGLRGNRSVQDERIVSASFSASATVEFNGLDVHPSESVEPSPAASQADLKEGGSPDGKSQDAISQFEDELLQSGNAGYDPKTGKRLVYGAQQNNLIVDARPTINAVVMQAMGKGSEDMTNYDFAKKAYLNIDNIHVMRDSLNMVIEAIKDGDISRLPPNRRLLEKSNWIRHIYGILDGSALIARQVGIQHSHVLIHCSDGWDRTSQLSALSQMMLDPYYRTIEGFIVLVEKDWLSFGHMFALRAGYLNHEKWFTVEKDPMASSTLQPGESEGRAGEVFDSAISSAKRFFNRGHGADSTATTADSDDPVSPPDEAGQTRPTPTVEASQATKPSDISPVFHQFLDATYQLLYQHPSRFEFNERFLRRLLYHLYAAQYGTFLWNSEKERDDAKAKERTRSVWDYFLSRRQEFLNPKYDNTIDDRQSGRERLVFPRMNEIRWWASAFGRSDTEMNEELDNAAARGERIGDYALNNPLVSSSPASRGRSPLPKGQPPEMPTSKSVLAGVESAHEALTPSLRQSATTDSPGAFADNIAKLKDSLANVDLGKGMFSGSDAGSKSTNSNMTATRQSTDSGCQENRKANNGEEETAQEMKDVTPTSTIPSSHPTGAEGINSNAQPQQPLDGAMEMEMS
ncbi:protein phosphatase [Apiospora phragmitis]|uniref:Protein phosphatase n=1 Tax=Apiospora phragmitis TaxID=2905665 RepID=A0ABR1W2L4_9PEZI